MPTLRTHSSLTSSIDVRRTAGQQLGLHGADAGGQGGAHRGGQLPTARVGHGAREHRLLVSMMDRQYRSQRHGWSLET
jgi:hypothetical protein